MKNHILQINTPTIAESESLGRVPKVSICVVTYNHEKYIGQCLQSLVEQKTNFDFEIIVGDDFSTDGTREIVKSFEKKYPSVIFSLFHGENIGPTRNYVQTHLLAQGEFVAHLDGDDIAYPGKLQVQYDFLSKNKNYVLVWHRVDIFDDWGNVNSSLHHRLGEVINVDEITLKDLAKFGSLGAASSLMYRKSAADFLKKIHGEALDYFIAISLLNSGIAARLDDILGGYRINLSQVTASKTKSRYFVRSPMRNLYASHLKSLYFDNKNLKEDIFLNAFFNFLIEIRFLRQSAIPFLLLFLRTLNISSLLKIPYYFFDAMKIRDR
ncbi:MAG: glycosyltransferase [Comamonas sp.]|uniref:glycosyltransferase n=1 Tax=Comamonas sp. TaxID=34028 RepID=UPI002FC73A26